MRDVTKILSAPELAALRKALDVVGEETRNPQDFSEYPKMLFYPEWLKCVTVIRSHTDALVVKQAKRSRGQ